MFEMFNGGDERIAFLVEYLIVKGVITRNASTWISKAGGTFGMKTDFFLKSDNKEGILNLMDSMDYDSYRKILDENLICKKCSGPVTIDDSSFVAHFNCEQCGRLNKEGVDIDYDSVQNTVNARTSKTSV